MEEVTRQTTIREVLKSHPGAARIFMEFGMHCLGCPSASAESLEAACATHGVDADELVDQLNVYIEEMRGV